MGNFKALVLICWVIWSANLADQLAELLLSELNNIVTCTAMQTTMKPTLTVCKKVAQPNSMLLTQE